MLFPKTNKQISRMGLGLAALGRPGYINLGHHEDLDHDYDVNKMERQTHVMLDKAYALGVRYFDAAQSYGKAESFQSSWLNNRNHEDVIVGSKWGYYYTAGWSTQAKNHEIKEHSIRKLNLQWPESKQRLSPWLKLYQIHSATFESGVLDNHAVLDRLFEIKSEGYKIGFSVSGPKQAQVIETALKIQTEGTPLFDSVQATYNILEQSVDQVLEKAADQGLTVIIKEGVANGRLTDRNHLAEYNDVLNQIARSRQTSIDSIALAFLLNKPFVHMVLSGAVITDHLISNLKATDIELSGSEIQTIESLRQSPEDYWKERSELKWN